MRILCDFLVIMGFLNKEGDRYGLTQDSGIFLDKRSPAYLGGSIDFISSPVLTDGFKNFAEAVRKGGTTSGGSKEPSLLKINLGEICAGNGSMIAMPSELMAETRRSTADSKLKILDIAAGHEIFGIAFARNNSQAEIVALDWPQVLEVAKENARTAGLADRYSTIEGSAFDVDYGSGHDLILLTEFSSSLWRSANL